MEQGRTDRYMATARIRSVDNRNNPLQEQCDKVLVQKAQNGDRDAFTALVQRYSNAVFAAALSRSRNLHDAEDIAQEVFVTAYFKLHQLREPGRIGPWLYQIARRTAVKWYRSKDSSIDLWSEAIGIEPSALAAFVSEPAAETASWKMVSEYLCDLSEDARTVVFLRYIADWTNRTIADFLEIPLGTVESRLARAKKHLRRLMAEVTDELKQARRDDAFAERVHDLIEVRIVAGPAFKEDQSTSLLFLEYNDGDTEDKQLPVVMQTEQIRSIKSALEGQPLPRPMTSDLLLQVITKLGGKVVDAVVVDNKESTYHAELHIRHGENSLKFDCRPSDAINIAIKVGSPVYVAKTVADQLSKPKSHFAQPETGPKTARKYPAGWFAAGSHPSYYEMGVDTDTRYDGRVSVVVRSRFPEPLGFGTFMQMILASGCAGTRLRFTANVKAEEVENWAGLWMRVEGPHGSILSFDNMHDRPITGTKNWEQYEITLDVPPNSTKIAYGLLLAGNGSVWMAGLAFEATAKEFPEETEVKVKRHMPEQPFNLEFA